MRLDRDPGCGEVDLAASADELSRLAEAVAAGEGWVGAVAPPDGGALAGIEVRGTSGPGVLVHVEACAEVRAEAEAEAEAGADAGPGRRILVISGDSAGRAVLAENLRGMASAEDGGHLHIEYHPGHFYLAEGSVPLVVNSPHGGMPTR